MKVAIAGATGAVGREMIADLEECSIENIELTLFASRKSEGKSIEFRGTHLTVKTWRLATAIEQDVVLMSAGSDFSHEFASQLSEKGVLVIDNSSAWRESAHVPLIVPEVNGNILKNDSSNIIANPNCSTIQLVVALAGLKDEFGLEIVNVSTYQSVSGSGQKGVAEIVDQVNSQFNFKELTPTVYPQTIAFNVLSAIGEIDKEGYCEEENKIINETQKILEDTDLAILATTARVPVMNCHAESVAVKLSKKVTKSDVESTFNKTPGLEYTSSQDQSELPSPRNVTGKPEVYVSRLRSLRNDEKSFWFQFWIVADNLKKGAATNAVQILELCHTYNRVSSK